MFLYPSKLPDQPTFAPTWQGEEEKDAAASALWDTTRDLRMMRDNSGAADNALAEAYDRRNKAIFEASGVQLQNPRRDFDEHDLQRASRMADSGGNPWSVMEDREADWQRQARELARERPELADVIGVDRPILDDAAGVARGAETNAALAEQRAAAAGVGTLRRYGNILGGEFAAMVRDPMQVGAMFIGGPVSGPARTVFARIAERVLSEAIVNGGIESAVQAASWDWKEQAGLDHSLGSSAYQVGIAGLFGGGIGGLFQGAGEVFRLLGRARPPELDRILGGEAKPGDMQNVADALGVKLDPETARMANTAAEQTAMDAEAFGPPPTDMAPEEATALAADTLRLVDDPPDVLPGTERAAAVERVVRSEFPLGPEPKRPVTLMQFLASRSVGGLRDEAGELAAMDLTRKFVPGGGALVRKTGKTLDYAREAAAEAGYFDHIYGDPETAVARSTNDDLLRALASEQGGTPVFSPRNDGGRIFDWQEHQTARARQDAFRRVVQDIDSAIDELGIDHPVDDSVLRRASQLVDDETDPAAALERAMDEDYRNYADALNERGEEYVDAADIPFFDDWQDTATVPGAGRAAGEARADGASGGRGADAADRGQLQGAGQSEGTESPPPLRQAGETPEPASDQAVADAEAILTEARGSETERMAAEQTLMEGVKPVSTKEKLEAKGAKPMRGGDAAPPEGGLFDLESRKQLDIWDAMPAAKEADGTVLHATYDTMIADAERSEHFSSLIKSCKD